MTKAQEIRNRRFETRQKDNTLQVEAEKVFDWILNMVDAETNSEYFDPVDGVNIFLLDGRNKLLTNSLYGREYDLSYVLNRYDRLAFFSVLKNVVEREEGFKAVLKPSATFGNSKAILFQVVIE